MRDEAGAGAPRVFLFLQGPPSPFFRRLARALADRGHAILRINLCGGDLLYWLGGGTNFRGSLGEWPGFLSRMAGDRKITDIVLFGDCRPYHEAAIAVARSRRIRTHIFEEGYFRPHWVTLEAYGTNGKSAVPSDPDTIRAMAARMPAPEKVVPLAGSYFVRGLRDIAGVMATLALTPLFRRFRRHTPDHPIADYAGWVRRLASMPLARRARRKILGRLFASGAPFYLVPLQLYSDYQIRRYSQFSRPDEPVEAIISSFAGHAPTGTRLLFKLHPLDNGLFDYRRALRRIASRYGVESRCDLIEGGDAPDLIRRSRGVVLVNSTMGIAALEQNRPVKTLGSAIYDVAGLTHQGPLDTFWRLPQPPDRELLAAYHRVTIWLALVNGGFFTRHAISVGTRAAADRMLAPHLSAGLMRMTRPAEGVRAMGPFRFAVSQPLRRSG